MQLEYLQEHECPDAFKKQRRILRFAIYGWREADLNCSMLPIERITEGKTTTPAPELQKCPHCYGSLLKWSFQDLNADFNLRRQVDAHAPWDGKGFKWAAGVLLELKPKQLPVIDSPLIPQRNWVAVRAEEQGILCIEAELSGGMWRVNSKSKHWLRPEHMVQIVGFLAEGLLLPQIATA